MKYYNEQGEEIPNNEYKDILAGKPIRYYPPITGWAIDLKNATTEETKEFLRLYQKINPKPLYRKQKSP